MAASKLPDDRGSEKKQNSWVQVGRYSQMALMLPAGTVAGWLLGVGARPLAAYLVDQRCGAAGRKCGGID